MRMARGRNPIALSIASGLNGQVGYWGMKRKDS